MPCPPCFTDTCLLMPDRQIDRCTAVTAYRAAEREQRHVVLCSTPGTSDSHVEVLGFLGLAKLAERRSDSSPAPSVALKH